MKRLLGVLFWLFAICGASGAFAAAPTEKAIYQTGGNEYDSLGAACTAYASSISQPMFSVTAPNTCKVGNNGWITVTISYYIKKVCSDGSPPDTSKPLDQQCPEQCPPGGTAAGSYEIVFRWATGPDANSAGTTPVNPYQKNWCAGTCMMTGDSSQPAGSCSSDGSPAAGGWYPVYCSVPMKYTGFPCTPTADSNPATANPEPSTPPPPEKNRCPLGTTQTGIDKDGIPICTGNPPKPPENKTTEKTTTQNPDGSTTEVTKETTTNSDGSTTEKVVTRTTGTDGSVQQSETTTTGNTPTGKPGTQDSTDKDREDLCKMNPTLTICRNSQVSGSCESVSCDGDAIQCAMYRQMQKEYCEQAKESAARTLGDALLTGADPLSSTLPTPQNGAVFTLGGFDQGGFLGGGSCVTDVTVSGVTLPLSQICDHILPLRFAIMTIAALVAFGMLRSSVFKG